MLFIGEGAAEYRFSIPACPIALPASIARIMLNRDGELRHKKPGTGPKSSVLLAFLAAAAPPPGTTLETAIP